MKTINSVSLYDANLAIINIIDSDTKEYHNLFIKKSKLDGYMSSISSKLTYLMLKGSEIKGVKLVTTEDTYIKDNEEHHYNYSKYIMDGDFEIEINYELIKENISVYQAHKKVRDMLDELL